MTRTSTLLTISLLLGGCSAFGAAAAEEPDYTVVSTHGAIEIREYGELLVAQTTVEGDYDDVSGVAFRRLAAFIFGDNQPRQKVAMTSPVLQEPGPAASGSGEKIAMTAPVLQQRGDESWVMTFIMPATYTAATLPRPTDPKVAIRTIPSRRVATVRFSGFLNKKKMERYAAELLSWIEENGYEALSSPRSAGYNPPWTLPPLRRNEIHIDVQ